MIGFLFVSLVAAYIATAAFVVTRLRTRRSRNITAIALVILPFVEVTVARVRFEYLCRTEYALQALDHTQRSTHLELRRGVQGGEVDYLRQLPWLDEVSNELSDGRFWVLSRRPNGAEETRFANQLPTDRLVLEEHRNRGWLNIRRYDLVVTSAATGSVVARSTEFVYWGDMLVRAFALRDGGTPHDWSCGRRIPIVEVLGGATGVAFNNTETEQPRTSHEQGQSHEQGHTNKDRHKSKHEQGHEQGQAQKQARSAPADPQRVRAFATSAMT